MPSVGEDALRLSDSQTLEISRSTPDRLALVSTWEPARTRPPVHWHPHQEERFEVLSGVLTVQLGGEEPRMFGEGDVIEVPRRVAHRMWNDGPDPASATWTISPAMRTEEMFRFIDQGLSGLRKVGLLVRFRHEFRLGSPRR